MSRSTSTTTATSDLIFDSSSNNRIHNLTATRNTFSTATITTTTTTTMFLPSASVTNVSIYETPSNVSSIHFIFNFQQTALVIFLSFVIVIVFIGNTLVIASIITTRRLRTITNCFIMSLAVADWLVGVFVMPTAVAYLVMGTWELGKLPCKLWLSLDVLLCTASILSLCAISVDRYLAVTQPLKYSRNRRSKSLALWMILIVWISSALITAPPMFGPPDQEAEKICRYNKNTGYVIFSAMGSFFIPMVVMLYVYVKISCVIAQRHDQLSHMDVSFTRHNSKQNHLIPEESDIERVSSEAEDAGGGGGVGTAATATTGAGTGSGKYRQMKTCSHITDGEQSPTIKNDKNNSTPSKIPESKLLKNNMNFSFENNHEPLTLVKNNSYRSTLPNKSKQEFDATILNYEPASRVSSFRRESKTAQTLSIVMGGFILCWLPFFVYYLLMPFIEVNETTMQILVWLGWINSAINPFIYAFYSADFRIAFWRLTVKHFKKSPPTISRSGGCGGAASGGGGGIGILNISMKQKRTEMRNLMSK